MTISKHRRRKSRHSTRLAAFNSTQSAAKRRATNDARRMALEPPLYPAERKAGAHVDEFIHARIYGQTVFVELRAPFATSAARPRCECVSVWADGACIIRSTGKTGAFAAAAERIARPVSRKQLAGMQQGYSQADEAEIAAEFGA
jgi:hypothetical protein